MRELQRCKVDWSELTPEFLSQISSHLNSSFDISNFRAVCKKWHSSSPSLTHLLDAHLPHQIPNHSTIFKQSNLPILLVRTAVYLLQPLDQTSVMDTVNPAKPWLVSVEELNRGKLRFRLPLTKNHVKNLPFNFPKTLKLSDFRVFCIGEGLKLCFADGNCHVFSLPGFPTCPIKVILLSDAGLMTIDDHTTVMLALFPGGYLASLRLESGKWRRLNFKNGHCFDDVVHFKGKACAIDRRGSAYIIDGCESTTSKAVTCPTCTGVYSAFERRKRLAESSGELYLIQGLDDRYEVYKLNENPYKWDIVNSLDNRIILVTCDDCFFVDAQKLPGFRGDCILHLMKHFTGYCYGRCFPTENWFDEASKFLEISVYYLNEGHSRLISSYPGLSDFFWPPPTWILPYSLSHARETGELTSMSSGLNCPSASESSSMSSTVQEIAQEEFPGQNISSWSDLPQELLLAIAQRVETLFDIIQFRAVCKTWRQSASFSSLPKRNLLSPILPYKISTLSHFFLSEAEEIPGESMIIVESSVFLLRSTLNPELPPWLFTVEELNPGKVYLRKPLSQLAIENLPENFPKMLQLSQFQVLKIGSLYTLRFEDDHRDMFGMGWCTFNSKVVLLVNSDRITTPVIHNYFVIVLYGDGDLAAMRLGNEEHSHLRSISGTRKFDDIVNFKGQIYAIDRRGRAYRMHNGQFVLESIVNDPNHPIGKGSGADRRKRLAESCGDLYLVYRRRDCGFRM